MASLRHLEAVVLGQGCVVLVAPRKLQGFGGLLVVDVGDSLEKEQRRDVALVLVLVDGPARDVAGPEQVISQLGFVYWFFWHSNTYELKNEITTDAIIPPQLPR